jgi:hypothetical protein
VEVVTPVGSISWCHMYDDALQTIVGKLHAGERAIVLPGEKRTSWHTFSHVMTLEASGWVERGSVEVVDLEEGEHGSR